MRSVVLIGGGGHARSVADVARQSGRSLAGCLAPGLVEPDLPQRLGGDDWLDHPEAAQHEFIVAAGQIGLAVLRRRLHGALAARSLLLATLQAPSAQRATSARVDNGTVLHHRSVVGPLSQIGLNCIINTGAIVEHDAQIGDHCHVSTGAIINGHARIGSGCMVGSGSVVLQGVSVADDVVIGAGAVVVADIVEAGVYVGVPARRLK